MGPDPDDRRSLGRDVVHLSMQWGEGQKGALTHENARTPRTHRGVEPHGQTYSGRAMFVESKPGCPDRLAV